MEMIMAERRLGQRSKKDKKWQYGYQQYKRIRQIGRDIMESDKFKESASYIQHGSMTVDKHCINVARYSLILADKLGINCNWEEMIRGALLHDYFQYDWHDNKTDMRRRLHGFYHPGIALHNAVREYTLTPREKDIIKKHMWPLTLIPPICREAWMVSAADKWCSLMETLGVHHGNIGKRDIHDITQELITEHKSNPDAYA
jgi:uncharacterized protein